jgi:hypothetical protein
MFIIGLSADAAAGARHLIFDRADGAGCRPAAA